MRPNALALVWIDAISAACARSPAWLARLVAAGIATPANSGGTFAAGLSTYSLAAGEHTIWWSGAAPTLALPGGTITPSDLGAAYLSTPAPATLSVTVGGLDPLPGHLVAVASVANRTIEMEGDRDQITAPRIVISPPEISTSLDSVGGIDANPTIELYLLGNGDPANPSAAPVAQRRYEINNVGHLIEDLIDQSGLRLLPWQLTEHEQSATVRMDPTGAHKGNFMTLISLAAEGNL